MKINNVKFSSRQIEAIREILVHNPYVLALRSGKIAGMTDGDSVETMIKWAKEDGYDLIAYPLTRTVVLQYISGGEPFVWARFARNYTRGRARGRGHLDADYIRKWIPDICKIGAAVIEREPDSGAISFDGDHNVEQNILDAIRAAQ